MAEEREVLAEISLYRYHIRKTREAIMELEDDLANEQDRMHLLSGAEKRRSKCEQKELKGLIAMGRGDVGRYERWTKRLRRALP